MKKTKKTADDCNCHYTGFHPSLGPLPKRKVKSKDLPGQSPSPKLVPATAKTKTAASKLKAKATTTGTARARSKSSTEA